MVERSGLTANDFHLKRLSQMGPSASHIRIPIRFKITLPYLLIAVVFALAASYIVTRAVVDSAEQRFRNQLASTASLASDWMVGEEDRLLDTLRLVAYTEGVGEAVTNRDADTLHSIMLTTAVNNGIEAIDILDRQGVSVLSLHHSIGGRLEEYDVSQGDTSFSGLRFVREVVAQQSDGFGDKFAGLVNAPWVQSSDDRDQFYFYVAGPLVDDNDQLVGAILVGRSLRTLVQDMRAATLATHITIYDMAGQPRESTLTLFGQDARPLASELVTGTLATKDSESAVREWTAGSNTFSELVSPWEARHGGDLGLLGSALTQRFLTAVAGSTRWFIFGLVAVGFFLVIAVGLSLAQQITQPLMRLVRASEAVAAGDLDVKVEPAGDDEVAVLAQSFNQMVLGLKEGSLYRDLLGRTVSPQVREQLRISFASGDVRLKGQNVIATVLLSDIYGFTSTVEHEDPATVLAWLNEYFDELVPIVTAHGGVVNKFDGDALLAFFGILPQPLSATESAIQACDAALEMIKGIERVNSRRMARGDLALVTGIGVNTGVVTAGSLGGLDRMHYTIIGDTVNTAQRIEAFSRELICLDTVMVLAGEGTIQALGDHRTEYVLQLIGRHVLRGKAEEVQIYRLWPHGQSFQQGEYDTAVSA